jgi:3-oxoadipate enol-lactonase
MTFARANGIVLHHQTLGRRGGPTVVFLNSLGSDMRIWQEIVPAFSDRFRIVLYDKRGHGLSDAPPAPYRIDDHVDDLVALLDHLQVERAVFVGVSVGGMIAQRLAVRAPDRVEALVLCDTAAKIGTPEMWSERIGAVESTGIESIADRILERWFTAGFRQSRTEDYAGWKNMLVRTPVHGYAGTCASIRDADLTADAGTIRAPTLCVVGDQDGSTPPDLVRQTASLVPGARFEIIANAGHIPSIEQPAALITLIDRHLRENERV